MEIEKIITLIDAVSSANIINFQIEEGNFRLSMDKLANKIESVPPVVSFCEVQSTENVPETETGKNLPVIEEAEFKIIESPIVGTYYSAAGPDSDDFVKPGDMVKTGQTLCIVEAMKLMNEIESDYSGEIIEILVKNEQMVEYGQPLFKIRA